MRNPVRSVAAAFALALALLAGCATTTAPPAATTSAGAITITDQAGRQVTLQASATKVFGAGPPAVTMIYALDPTILAGWNAAPSASAKPYLTAASQALPVLGRVTGGKDTFNPEVLATNKVDLIIDAGDINPSYIASNDDLQKRTGIPVIMLSTDPAKMAEGFELLGKATGRVDQADQLSADVKRLAGVISTGVSNVGDAKASVFYAAGAEGLSTALSGSINARVIDAIGATNVAGATTKSGRVDLNAEQVLTFDPDWVIISPDTPTDSIAQNPADVQPVGSLKAIAAGRYLVTPNSVPFGWFDAPPSVNQLLGMVWAGESIYPREFEVDLLAETVSFYKLYFHYDLSTEAAEELLATAHTPGFNR